jgi:Flp pilus assembly protein TadD
MAAEQFEKALQIDSGDFELQMRTGIMLASQGNIDNAIRYFAQAVRLEPNNPEALYNMGVALTMDNKPREAIEYLKGAFEANPSWPEPAIWLARILAANPDPQIRDPNGAVAIALKAAELTQYHNAEALEILAVSYAAAGRYDETAQKALSQAEADKNEDLAGALRDMLEQYKNQSGLK